MQHRAERPVELEGQYLVFKFYYCLDTRDYSGAAHMFHPNGVWLRQEERLIGPAGILDALALRSKTVIIHHVITNLWAENVDANHAKITAYLTAYRYDSGNALSGAAPFAGPTQVGFCRADISRLQKNWRIAYLETGTPTFQAPSLSQFVESKRR